MTALFANDLELWLMLVLFVTGVVGIALFTRLNLAVIRGDRAASGYESWKDYGIWEICRMHKVLFERSWTRRVFGILAEIELLAFVPYAVLSLNDLFHNNLLHLISRGR